MKCESKLGTERVLASEEQEEAPDELGFPHSPGQTGILQFKDEHLTNDHPILRQKEQDGIEAPKINHRITNN